MQTKDGNTRERKRNLGPDIAAHEREVQRTLVHLEALVPTLDVVALGRNGQRDELHFWAGRNGGSLLHVAERGRTRGAGDRRRGDVFEAHHVDGRAGSGTGHVNVGPVSRHFSMCVCVVWVWVWVWVCGVVVMRAV